MKLYDILTASLAASSLSHAALKVTVSPDGKTLPQALSEVSAVLKNDGLPDGGVIIEVEAGEYPFEKRHVLGSEFRGTPGNPIVIRAREPGQVWFRGSREIKASAFTKVTDESELARLAPSSRDHILATTVTDPKLLSRLRGKLMQNLILDGQAYLPSAFPNSGYAYLKEDPVTPEVSPPAILPKNVNYGVRAGRPPQQELGKPFGWRGSLSEPRGARVGIGKRGDEMAGSWSQWEAELKYDNSRNSLTGFIEANWLLSSQGIHAASEADQCLHLSRALTYGWKWRQRDKPFRIFGMLCEVDRPGEWRFDPKSNRLFLYPLPGFSDDSRIALALADGFLELKESSYVEVRGLSVHHVASGSVYRLSGSDNLVSGCTVKDSTATGVSVSGRRNAVRGCDLLDLHAHVRLEGGRATPDEITTGENVVSNCHIYQKNVRHLKVNIALRGVGNTFTGNLVHNSIGQAMTVGGNDHLVSLNEFFNIGFEEGDGGAIYAGGDLTGYGVRYQYNFFHHLMHVPGKVERSGIHLDDLQAGATCIGNIFYKSAAKGIHMNGGAGHILKRNIFLEGHRGAYNVGQGGRTHYKRQLSISADPKSPQRLTKEDYVGRAEKKVGKEGWNNEPWKSRYPLFAQVMNKSNRYGRLWPIHCTIEQNLYYGNQFNETIWSRCPPEVLKTVSITGEATTAPVAFVDYERLDFRLFGAPDFPFQKIGLQLTEDRKAMPHKTYYRMAVKNFFEGIRSMPGTTKTIDTAIIVESAPLLKDR